MTAKACAFIDMPVDRFAAEQRRFDPAYSRSE
jgi:hypothetical protein